MIRGCLDYLTTSETSTINLYSVLGKSPTTPSSSQRSGGKTPLNVPKVAALYHTPESEFASKQATSEGTDNLLIEDTDLAERLGLNNLLNGKINQDANAHTTSKTTPKISGMPRFKSSYTWAQDSSPAVLQSSEKNPNVADVEVDLSKTPTGKPGIKDPVLDVLVNDVEMAANGAKMKDAKDDLMKAIAFGKEQKIALKRKRAPKRSILRDIANMKTPSILVELEKCPKILPPVSEVQDRPPKRSKDGAKSEPTKPKKKSTKSAPPLMKGQMKMTAFLRM